MFSRVQKYLPTHRADVVMSVIIVIWGIHFIIVKDAIQDLPALAFNALRFVIGLPVLLIAAVRAPGGIRIARADLPRMIGLGMLGPLGYQVFFILAIERTTSTNTALLTSTSPMWTALLALLFGMVMICRPMLVGVAMSVVGVSLVVLGRADSGLALSSNDLLGSALALGGALVTALYNISIKPLVDRYGSTTVAVWVYVITMIGLLIVAIPDLARLSADQLPPRVWPNLFYSGVLSCGLGFLAESYAIRALGPTRMSSYSNFTPIVAAAAGIAVLGESISLGVLAGGALTLIGVVLVRRNTYLRLPPAPVRTPAQSTLPLRAE